MRCMQMKWWKGEVEENCVRDGEDEEVGGREMKKAEERKEERRKKKRKEKRKEKRRRKKKEMKKMHSIGVE